MRRRLIAAAVSILATAACSGGGAHGAIKLDGSPHRPTDQGVVTAADARHVIVDGARRYRVDRSLIVFSSGTLQLAPLSGTVGRYALLATKGGLVEWIEPLTVVTTFAGLPRTVFFFGTLTSQAGGQATFSDGTVLQLAPGAGVPPGTALPAPVRADIDPVSHRVRVLTAT